MPGGGGNGMAHQGGPAVGHLVDTGQKASAGLLGRWCGTTAREPEAMTDIRHGASACGITRLETAATLRPRMEVKAALNSLIRIITGKAPGQKVDQCL